MRILDVVKAAVVAGGLGAGPAWAATAGTAEGPTAGRAGGASAGKAVGVGSCAERAKAYAEKIAANPDHSSSEEWDRLGRDCLERGNWAEGIRTYRRGVAYHKDLQDRMANLGVIYAESSRWELAYCLAPKNKHYKKNWERTKRTARLCDETNKKGFLFVPADLRDR